ncbi:TetR/AcrR family transcriptional regulator [Amycolatopsis acidicola]|uniref:TetR/AcrR family transcriptional regulator n=1 Tax=Amycolatopsis acidicola TaxID=2596893 RepID=UPI001AA05CCB|nr:TetR family transcriptional regulator [Amycolatopsis acidicola]
MTDEPDGRRRRGLRRRAVLIDATLRVVSRDGVAAVTHRAVAQEAGLPGSAVSHQFASIDELLSAALTSQTEQLVAALTDTADLTGFAAELVRLFGADTSAVAARYELYLRAARNPATRESTGLWLGLLATVARHHTEDPVRAQTFASVVDGYFLQRISTGTPPSAAELERLIRAALGA